MPHQALYRGGPQHLHQPALGDRRNDRLRGGDKHSCQVSRSIEEEQIELTLKFKLNLSSIRKGT